MWAIMEWDNRQVLIIGKGKSGMAAAARLQGLGAKVSLYDDKDWSGTDWPQLQGNAAVRQWDRVILSPAIPPNYPLVATLVAMGVAVYSELDVGWSLWSKPLVAVTGTNGKTTTVRLVVDLLGGAGYRAIALGNIGTPLCGVDSALWDYGVVEVSSFQLQQSRLFRCNWGAITNMGVDHIAYHGSLAVYHAAKCKLATMADGWVYNADDNSMPTVDKPSYSYSCRRTDVTAFYDADALWLRTPDGARRIVERKDFAPIGIHNVYNALCALGLAYAAVGDSPTFGKTLASFVPEPMRLQPVRSGGRLAINDSKSTNLASVQAALACMNGPTVLLMGGYDKGEDFSPLFLAVPRCVVRIVLFGAAAPRLADQAAAAGYDGVLRADDVHGAVRLALAIPKTTVLFSPGCSSFDAYSSYRERGYDFEKEFCQLAQ